MVEVWWIRHGESIRNAGFSTDDTYSAPLTDLGHAQARRAAQSLPGKPDLLVSSSFLRARQTSDPAIARFADARLKVWPVHEYHFLCDHQTRGTNRVQREPMVLEYWRRCDPHHVHGVGAESFAGFMGRVDDSIRRLRSERGPWIVVYSHQHFILGVLFRLACPAREPDAVLMAEFRDWLLARDLPNAGLVQTDLAASGPADAAPGESGIDQIGPVLPLNLDHGWR